MRISLRSTPGPFASAALAALFLGASAPVSRGPPAAAVVVPAVPRPVAADSGYRQFVKQQSDLAKAATRKRDYAAAEAAWNDLLELDPASLPALEGLVALAKRQEDADAEALALRRLNQVYERLIAAGEKKIAKLYDKSVGRRAALDPRAEEAEVLLADYRDAMAELGAAYLEEGMHANALVCWLRHLELVEPESESEATAKAAVDRCGSEGPDWLARLGLAPEDTTGGKTDEWIANHDKKTSKWSSAAKWETPHYRIRTNGGWRLGAGTAQVMEQVHAFYREIWGIVPDPKPNDVDPDLLDITVPPIAINIYGNHKEYLKMSGAPEWSGGVFKGSEVATYDHGQGSGKSSRATYQTLFHEASHQFMAVAVGNAPSFINEGVASLFEGIEILPNGTIRRDLPVPTRLTDLAPRLRGSNPLRLAEVMGGPNADNNEPKFYAPRWGFVYFLRMYVDEQGNYPFRERFADYLLEFKKGTPGDAVGHFTEFFLEPLDLPNMQTFDDFEVVWRQFILDLEEEQRSKNKRQEEFGGAARMAMLKKDWATALRFYERILDIDPGDVETLVGVAEAAGKTDEIDRAVYFARAFLDLAPEDHKQRGKLAQLVAQLDPNARSRTDARRRLVGGMAALALRYDKDGMPLNAMQVGYDVLAVDPYEASARALVTRLERETGRSVIGWERLFNGFDLSGWYAPGGDGPYFVEEGQLVCDYDRVPGQGDTSGEEAGVSLYSNLFIDRDLRGDWTIEVRIRTDRDWEIAGLCFGAKGEDRFEGIVLRKTGKDGQNNVDFGTFDGAWSFRGDGSYKATYDPTSPEGTLLRVEVKNRQVAVTIDGVELYPIDGGKKVRAIPYPMAALRGDVGLLASRGITRFADLRLRSGSSR